jgi:hypothetical protein
VSSLLAATPSLLLDFDVDEAAVADLTEVEELLAVEVPPPEPAVSIVQSAVAEEELEAVLSSEE